MLPDEPTEPSPARRARLFTERRNQALRIPREFEPAADEVVIHRQDDRLVVEPVGRMPTLAAVLARLKPLDDDFPAIADPPTLPEDVL